MTAITPSLATSQIWDVVVVGTGMGGGLAGRRLAEAGLNVLFIEKGPLTHPRDESGAGYGHPHREARLLRGVWPSPIEATVDGRHRRWFGPVGCGVGGSSLFYAAALERPLRHDIDDMPDTPHPTGGWPVGYDALAPYYTEAAHLLHLSGEADPLDDGPPLPMTAPPPAEAGDAALINSLRKGGAHPYRLNLAIKRPDTCKGCFGRKCPYDCKMDGRSAGVLPALSRPNAALLERTEVLQILADGRTVRGLRVRTDDDDEYELRARAVVLAAGALNSPRLLMASDLANSSGRVGTGLMFHLNEMFAVWPQRPHPPSTAKSVALRDLAGGPDRFGMVQSMGVEADYGSILKHLGQLYDGSPFGRFRKGRKLIKFPAAIAARLVGSAGLFVGFLEDLSLEENRILPPRPDDDTIRIEYRSTPALLARRRAFRRAIRRTFKGHRVLLLGTRPEPNFGHPAGTLRFGTDPATSVLNPDCRAHDLDNLWVADASFMPTSLGTNPSFTIAANALRVADVVAGHVNGTQRAAAQ